MTFFSILTAIALLIVAIAIIAYFFRVLLQNIHANPKGWSEKWGFKRRERVLQLADEQIQKGNLPRAAALLRESFYLDHIKGDPFFVEKVHHHHMEVLSRLLSISEKLGAHLSNIAVVEGLFQSRSDLMKAYIDTLRSQESLDEKRKEKGQVTPEWALAEFAKRLDEIKDKLTTNDRSLSSQLEVLFASLSSQANSSEVTYH